MMVDNPLIRFPLDYEDILSNIYKYISPIVEWSHSVKLVSILYNLGFQFFTPPKFNKHIPPNTSWWLNQPHLNNMRKSNLGIFPKGENPVKIPPK